MGKMIPSINIILIAISLLTANALQCRAQKPEDAMSQLEELLLTQKDTSSKYRYAYWSYKNKDSIVVFSSYPHKPQYLKHPHVERLTQKIRDWDAIYLLPRLEKLLVKFEDQFTNEWAPVYDFMGGSVGLWDDQFETLCLIELTITFLESSKEKWSPSTKYSYLKDIIDLYYLNYNTNKINKSKYKSQYIKKDIKGHCSCTLLKGVSSGSNIADYYFHKDPEMIELLVRDIQATQKMEIDESTAYFFNIFLRNIFVETVSDLLDSLLVSNPEFIIHIGYNDQINHFNTKLPIEYYHLLLRRYRFASKNPRFIDILLEDLSALDITLDHRVRLLNILKRGEDHLIDYLIVDWMINYLEAANSDDAFGDAMFIYEKVLNNNMKKQLLHKLSRWQTTNHGKDLTKLKARIHEHQKE